MMGCLKAFAKTTATKKFYDLERLKVKGMSTEVDLGFDESRVLNQQQIQDLKHGRPDLAADVDFEGTGPRSVERRRGRASTPVPASIMACGAAVNVHRQEEEAVPEQD